MKTSQQTTGSLSEKRAEKYLKKHGLKTIQKNFSCKLGEIDIIMRDHDVLVFVEVRTRQNENYANSLESVMPAKQRRIIKTALYYLQMTEQVDKTDCRFDVIGIDQGANLTWIKNAFQVE